jgi:transcriptional regulator with XRE-family HTH domain
VQSLIDSHFFKYLLLKIKELSMIAKKKPAFTSGKTKSVADYITNQINACGKSQIQIAEEVGFDKPNVITMIKQGKTKVPVSKIGSMAKALEVDPIFFLKLCMQEYMPDFLDTVVAITEQPIITANELELVKAVRAIDGDDPKLGATAARAELKLFISSVTGKKRK